MWNTILLNIILSIAIIAIAHNIWEYLKTNYSTQKTKNLAEIHAAKYKTILNDLSSVQDVALIKADLTKADLTKADLTKADLTKAYLTNTVPNNPKSTEFSSDLTPTSRFISAEEQAWMKQELDSFIQSL